MKPLLKVETYTSESLPHESVITNNMLNSTKTWQERFDEITSDEDGLILSGLKLLEVKQFISDIRKRDMEALIGMLPEDDNSETFLYRNRVKKIIKDYYEN